MTLDSSGNHTVMGIKLGASGVPGSEVAFQLPPQPQSYLFFFVVVVKGPACTISGKGEASINAW